MDQAFDMNFRGPAHTSERKQCDMADKHRGFLRASKAGPDQAKRLRSCLIGTN
jgi:hypothetical protein